MAKFTKEEAIAELSRRKQMRESSKGFEGIGSDIASSLESAPKALGNMITDIPGGLEKAGRYALSNNPVETLANLGAGGVEGGAQLLSSPRILSRYLNEKFPRNENKSKNSTLAEMVGLGSANDPTLYENLMNFEKNHGLGARNEDEASVRNIGNLIFGGKGLTKLPNAGSRLGAITAQQAGAGGDPVHAALLGMIGELAANKLGKKMPSTINERAEAPIDANVMFNGEPSASINPMMNQSAMNVTLGGLGFIPPLAQKVAESAKTVPGKVANAVNAAPEMLGKGAASLLETAADYGSKLPGGAEILQPTIGALAAYLKHKSVSPEQLAERKLFGDLTSEDLPRMNERIEAAKRLGISFITPGEALLSPFQTAKEANIGRTSAGSQLLYEKGKQRGGTEGKAINNLLDTIYDQKELAPEKKAAYEEAMSKTVPNDFVAKWKQNPIVEWAIKQMDTNPTYKSELQHTPKDSFEYWNIVKRVIGDLEKGEAQGMKGFSSNAATKVRNRMVDEMDVIEPRYEQARNIAEREFTRKDLEKVFDKKTMTLNNFWSFLKSEKAFNKVMKKLAPFPDAQQKLQDIRLLSNEIIPFDESIRSSYKLEKTGMTKDRNKLDALKRDLDERYGKEHDIAAVNLMTNPEWLSMLSEYLKKKGK